MPQATNPGSISSENVFTFLFKPLWVCDKGQQARDRRGAPRTTFLRQLSISTRRALRVRLGGDCFYPMGHLAGHYFFGEWDIVRVFSYSGELSFGWWVLVLKSDDSRLKWISHLIQMLAVKNRSFWDRRDGTSVKGTYRCSIQFPASTWHQMELQLSVTPSNALFWPLWCTGIHAGWTSVHLNGWKSPSG